MFCKGYKHICRDSAGNNYVWLDLISDNEDSLESNVETKTESKQVPPGDYHLVMLDDCAVPGMRYEITYNPASAEEFIRSAVLTNNMLVIDGTIYNDTIVNIKFSKSIKYTHKNTVVNLDGEHSTDITLENGFIENTIKINSVSSISNTATFTVNNNILTVDGVQDTYIVSYTIKNNLPSGATYDVLGIPVMNNMVIAPGSRLYKIDTGTRYIYSEAGEFVEMVGE